MALKLGYYHPDHWASALKWRGQGLHMMPPHAIVVLEEDALVGLLGYELGDGAVIVVTGLDVNPALLEEYRQRAANYLLTAATQLGKMLCRRVIWAGQEVQKVAPQRAAKPEGGQGPKETSAGDVSGTSGSVKEGEEVDW